MILSDCGRYKLIIIIKGWTIEQIHIMDVLGCFGMFWDVLKCFLDVLGVLGCLIMFMGCFGRFLRRVCNILGRLWDILGH